MTDGRTTRSFSRETATKQNPVGATGGVLGSGTTKRTVPSHEDGISLPSKSIAVCSISDSGSLPRVSFRKRRVRPARNGIGSIICSFANGSLAGARPKEPEAVTKSPSAALT
jgi:hypothetical protein